MEPMTVGISQNTNWIEGTQPSRRHHHNHHHHHPYNRSEYFPHEFKKFEAPIFDGEMKMLC